ncbi:hypothetical protein D081_0448 [Anaerovibrio sp. JC8]|uniref:hypothetical protein n=1 Tax=Anaerovibrio sp. JC8 TaxID=1240085 RepID=UPI000A0E488B|nr:hypothetical protein [Anaerovibrio sp. JC8]ORU01000.1 hypothetical protein D081_0448 [Anaerovibrio sp. JC8]
MMLVSIWLIVFWISILILLITYFIHLLSEDYFNRNFIMDDNRWGRCYQAMMVATTIMIVLLGSLDKNLLCFALLSSALWIFVDYFQLCITDHRKCLFAKKRRHSCNRLPDERIINEWIWLTVDNGFTAIFWKTMFMLFKFFAIIFVAQYCWTFGIISSPFVEIHSLSFNIGDENSGSIGIIVSTIALSFAFLWRNYIELQTRRIILEALVETKGLKQKV